MAKIITPKQQLELFEWDALVEKLRSFDKDPLAKLNDYIRFEYFRKELEKIVKRTGEGPGRPSYDVVMMFKLLIVQRIYDLSDESMEFQIADRTSFKLFLGIRGTDQIPDARTIWSFKNELSLKKADKRLFKKLDQLLHQNRVIINKGSIVDAHIVESEINRNSKEDNDLIKNGQIPQEWEDNPNIGRQKDSDARWVKHHNRKAYGYKDHVKIDKNTKLITNYEITPANVYDGEMTDVLIEKRDKGKRLYGDSASWDFRERIRKKGMIPCINQKGRRNRPLNDREQDRNTNLSRTRARVEHVFGCITTMFGKMKLRCIGKVRSSFQIGLTNITYNLFRIIQLKRKVAWA
ncbi:MAG: IS5 family transposase [Saprospiraceae bacterium]|nr:IS5 family transposase [Saprospiraceae bacterium]MBK8955257.1 IS5 family transposase [Saprospiraceae bacterium]MBK8955272.1 IS5 family transposase [Saprospiraceae bacterium]MBK8955279.1 IS5 family transposase [Saprospiraceae bacterium]MBK8955283.1 IS5 family transposase [Saprospiraceae bacterium]